MDQSRPTTCDPQDSTAAGGITMHYALEAEQHVRSAARIVELDPDADAQRTAAVLYRLATRLRGHRGEVTVRW